MLNKIEEASGGSTNEQELKNSWYPARDKAGSAYAVIRFLPAKEDDAVAFIKRFDHFFAHKGKWLVENCPSTRGDACCVCDSNKEIWDASPEIVRGTGTGAKSGRKRNLKYFANIFIVSDPANPENEGTVKQFKYGAAIQKMIEQAYKPEFEDETSLDVFDLWEGGNFKLKIRKHEGRVNYDKSSFEASAPLFDDDKDIEAVWNKIEDLSWLVADDKFSSPEKLKANLDKVLGNTKANTQTAETLAERVEREVPASENASASSEETPSETPSDTDDTLAFFESLED